MKVIKLMKGLYKYIILMLVFSLLQVFCELYLPEIMSKIIDIGITSEDTVYIMDNAINMLIITITGVVSSVIVVYSSSKFANLYGANIRKALYKKINSFSKREIDEFGASTLITRSTNNVSNITSTFSYGLRLLIFAPVMGIGGAIMGYKTAPHLAPIVLIAISILFLALIIIFIFTFPKFEKAQRLLDKLNARSREILTGIRVIKSFRKEKYFKSRFEKVNDENMKLQIFLNKLINLVQPLMLLTINLSIIAIVYIGAGYIEKGFIEIGAMMAFIQYLSMILMSFLIILVIIINIPRVLVSFKRINEILIKETDVKNNGTLKITNIESLEFKNVYFKYPDAKGYLLKNINFRVERGEKIGILGSSASGKTTIINLLLRHMDPTEGTILINGIDIKEYDIKSLRNLYAYTPQKTLLFKGTIKENLLFEKEIENSNIEKALKIASIDDFIKDQKEGYEYKVEQSAINLSGGQKQRMSIARALISGGEILLFDDSFSAVDFITDKKIRKEIDKNYKDKIVIFVSQRVDTIKDSDKIIIIEEGQIEALGKYKDLVKTSKTLGEFILSQRKELK